MNALYRLYFNLPHDSSLGLFSKIINRIVARIIKIIFDCFVPLFFKLTESRYSHGLNQELRKKDVVVSLTSFPGRIEHLWIVIECMFRQRFLADRIILWLSKEEFEGIQLPKRLVQQQKRGLEIIFVTGNTKSHKKYLGAFKEFNDSYIVTIDDDLYYDDKLLLNLIQLKEKFPNSIPANRAHEITFNSQGFVMPYSKWNHNYKKEAVTFLLMPTGGFGTLYEASQFGDQICDVELLTRLAPTADDIWLKVNSLITNTKVSTNFKYNKDPITIKSSQHEKLVSKNVKLGGNDEQMANVLKHFKLGNLERFRNI